MSTQAKRCEMRPHPASKKTEGGRARLGREVHVVSKYSEIEIGLNRLTCGATTKSTCILANTIF